MSTGESELLAEDALPSPKGGQDRPAPGGDVKVYDFRSPHRVSKERLRTLEAMYGRLAKSLEGWLMGRVRGQIEVSLQSVEQLSFGQFTHSLTTPCCSYIFDVSDSGGQAGVIDFGGDFAFYLVERLFGGAGTHKTPERALTPIERMAVRVVADRMATLVSEIWADHTEMDLILSGWESIPEILQVANREDPVLVTNIAVATASMRSTIQVCLPFSILEKFFASPRSRRVTSVVGSEREREMSREMTETSLRTTRVDIAARLPQFKISLTDIGKIQVGGVVNTGIPANAKIELLVSGRPRFEAVPGKVGSLLAVRIVQPIGVPAAGAGSSINESNG